MKADTRDLAIALAGVFQAVHLVQQAANGEAGSPASVTGSIRSLFSTDPASVQDVFGDLNSLRTGLEVLCSQLGRQEAHRKIELTRYAVTVLHLERKLAKRSDLITILRQGIDRAREQNKFFELTHPNIIASLADIYKQTVSTLQPRIMVSGDQALLSSPENKNMIRAQLLAAVRAAVLWRQCGGSRIKLFLQRRALIEQAVILLQQAGTG